MRDPSVSRWMGVGGGGELLVWGRPEQRDGGWQAWGLLEKGQVLREGGWNRAFVLVPGLEEEGALGQILGVLEV